MIWENLCGPCRLQEESISSENTMGCQKRSHDVLNRFCSVRQNTTPLPIRLVCQLSRIPGVDRENDLEGTADMT
jgi:hypothetical protein